jgi:2-keto-4-pentenoate hydratase/2-oxohepta-3-ene-1,7-dioic acid hydratase in catechol pathway
MKLMSFSHSGRSSFGVVVDGRIIDLGASKGRFGLSLKDLLVSDRLETLGSTDLRALPHISSSEVTFEPVIPDPAKILCIGINYATHVKETGRETPVYPMIFTRFADSQVGHGQSILRPAVSAKLDFDGELAVIIGRPVHRVKASDA